MERINRFVRRRNACLIAAAIAWPILIVAILLDPVEFSADWPLWAQIAGGAVFFVVVLNTAIFAPVAALVIDVEARAFRRLARGENIVARWTTSPAAWQAFLAAEARVAGGGPVNLLDTTMAVPPEGIACVATGESVLIGEDFHSLGSLGLVSNVAMLADPGAIQVDATAPRGRFGFAANRLRFPITYGRKPARDVQTAWLYRAGLIGNAGAAGNPLRRRNLALLGLAIGIALCAVPIARHGFIAVVERGEGGLESLALVPGIFLVAFGLGFALRFHIDSRRAAAALGGAGEIGRWRVPPAAWEAFQQQETVRRQQDAPWNLVPATIRPGRGVAVIATAEGVSIAGGFFHLPSFASERLTGARWIEGSPACLELTGLYRARVGSFSRFAAPSGDRGAFALRFPVAAGAEAVAREALRQWKSGLSPR